MVIWMLWNVSRESEGSGLNMWGGRVKAVPAGAYGAVIAGRAGSITCPESLARAGSPLLRH